MLPLNLAVFLVALLAVVDSSALYRVPYGKRIDQTLLDKDNNHHDYDTHSSSGYEKDNKQDLVSGIDEGSYKDAENMRKLHENSNESKGGSITENNDSRGHNEHKDQQHRRKNKKSGFKNSYHKDESGSDSSFFEDSTDDGGNAVYNNVRNQQGNDDNRRYYDRRQDGGHKLNDNRQYGDYGVRGELDARKGRIGKYDRGNKYADTYQNNKQLRQKDLEYYPSHGNYQGRYQQPYDMDYDAYDSQNSLAIYDDEDDMYADRGYYEGSRRYPQMSQYRQTNMEYYPNQMSYRGPVQFPRSQQYPSHLETHSGRYRY